MHYRKSRSTTEGNNCPESRNSPATQHPSRRTLDPLEEEAGKIRYQNNFENSQTPKEKRNGKQVNQELETSNKIEPGEKHFTIFYGDTGHSYESILGPYLPEAKSIEIEDPYIRAPHQIQNLVRFCEAIVKISNIKRIDLKTGYDDDYQKMEAEQKLGELKQSLLEIDIIFDFDFNPNIHDREMRLDNGWVIKIGRGLDFYQKPQSWHEIGSNDLSLRKCLETKVDIYKVD